MSTHLHRLPLEIVNKVYVYFLSQHLEECPDAVCHFCFNSNSHCIRLLLQDREHYSDWAPQQSSCTLKSYFN